MRAVGLLLLALALLSVCDETRGSHRRSKRGILDTLTDAGSQVLKKAIKDSAFVIAKEGAMSFLEEVEIEVLKDMIKKVEFDKMQKKMKERLLKATLMANATVDIYDRHYECSIGSNYLDLTFHFGAPQVNLPEKWLLKFFN